MKRTWIFMTVALLGCSTAWSVEMVETAPSYAQADAGNGDAACIDPSGFDGRGCFRCTPTTNEELLGACTTARFEAFDNEKRIIGFDPKVHPAPTTPLDLSPYDGGASTEGPTLPAPPPCPTPPSSVMVLGATGFPLDTLAKAMGPSATIFYLEKGSCDGVASIVLGDPMLSGEVVYYDANGTKNRCMMQEARPADIGLSALFAESCANTSGLASSFTLPSSIEDLLGPVSPVMFAVPATSTERSISAEAAYRVYGLGTGSGVSPWLDENDVFRRGPTSGNQFDVAVTLGLPIDAFHGRDSNGSSNMLNALRDSPAPRATIGISSSEIVDPNRDVVKSLAYAHYGQPVAFYPDSDPASFDRKNVRDGHYFMWMPLHAFVRTTTNDDTVRRLVNVMTYRQQAPVASVDLFGALKRTGNVPQCAMHVRRAKEGAPLEPFTPIAPCDCAFEAAAPGTTPPECLTCSEENPCANGKRCSFGFCE